MNPDEVEYDLAGNPITPPPSETDTPEVAIDPVPEQPDEGPLEEEWAEDTWDRLQATPTASTEDLSDIIHAMESYQLHAQQLTSLYHTVAIEGVSQSDIETLSALHETLVGHAPAVSVEGYQALYYTGVRSGVSLSIANESFAQTLVQTIKAWINRLVEFIGRVIEWTVKTLFGEKKYTLFMDRHRSTWKKANDARRKVQQLMGTHPSIPNEMQQHADKLLNGEALVYSPALEAAFGDKKTLREIAHERVALVKLAADVSKQIDALKKDLSDDGPIKATDKPMLAIAIQRSVFEDFVASNDTVRNSITTHWRTVFDDPPPSTVAQVTPFEEVVAEYHVMRRRLKEIKSINRKERLPEIVGYINEITTCVSDLGTVISALKTINDTKLQVLSLYVNYENYYLNQLYLAAKQEHADKGLFEQVERVINEIRTNVAATR